jgi:hypothetical protein
MSTEEAIAVVRRNTEEVQGKATTKYLRNCSPRILSTIHRNQAVSAQIATEH